MNDRHVPPSPNPAGDVYDLTDVPSEVQPRAMRQPVSPTLLIALLLLVLGTVAATGFLLWSAYSAPIGEDAAGRSPFARQMIPTDEAATLPARLPEVAPNTNIAVAPELARERNAAVPFRPDQLIAARPFMLPGTTDPADRERAITCLAAAAYYEAGNDVPGMAAVAQVVLNRVRHPAFPASVCGVVFQGAERRTGCQFTFTCDGALARAPQPAIWQRARQAAILALTGFVFRPVGQATHYHTDWVVPYWSGQLVKIAQVHTHLFFRWPGGWGGPAAFHQPYRAGEAIDPRIAGLVAPADDLTAPTLTVPALTPTAELSQAPDTAAALPAGVDLGDNSVRGYDRDQASFLLQLAPTGFAGSYAVLAYRLCKDRTPCRVAGWRNAAAVPRDNVLTEQARRGATFLYERLGPGNETARWNCREIPRADPAQCIAGTN